MTWPRSSAPGSQQRTRSSWGGGLTRWGLRGIELQVHGSPQLVRSLLAYELIDEYQVLIYPVVLGHGRRIFDDPGFAAAFRLAGSATTRSGIAVLTYLPAGKPRYGSFASDPEPERHRILR
jgi:riboflavin biosynthesis pyrimidine reductase